MSRLRWARGSRLVDVCCNTEAADAAEQGRGNADPGPGRSVAAEAPGQLDVEGVQVDVAHALELALEQWRNRNDPATVLKWEQELEQLTAAAHQDLDGERMPMTTTAPGRPPSALSGTAPGRPPSALSGSGSGCR